MTTIKTIETVECATDAKCCICGKNIIAYELHNETVEMNGAGEIVRLIDSYHIECEGNY